MEIGGKDTGCYGAELRSSPNEQRSALLRTAISELTKITDFCLILLSAFGAYVIYFMVNQRFLVGGLGRYIVPSLFGSMIYVSILGNLHGYDLRRLGCVRWQVSRVFYVWGSTVLLLISLAFFANCFTFYSWSWVFSWFMLAFGIIVSQRALLSSLLSTSCHPRFLRTVAIVGASDSIKCVVDNLQDCQDERISVCGIFSDRRSLELCGAQELSVSGGIDDLLRLAQQVEIDYVVVALPLDDQIRLNAAIHELKRLPGEVFISVPPISQTLPVRGLSYIGGLPMLEIVGRPITQWAVIIKWIEDKSLAVLGLVALTPAMMIIALLVKFTSRGPIFFVQQRRGFNHKIIKVLKFRTMYVDHEDQTGGRRTVRGDRRVTRVGRMLRGTSLDELPQLINVLKGEMSLVGPRPHAIAMKVGSVLYCDSVDEYAQRHRVKPGITGWAQVNGFRGEVDSLEKGRARVKYDLDYIERWSIWLDLKILVLTLPAVLSRRNAY